MTMRDKRRFPESGFEQQLIFHGTTSNPMTILYTLLILIIGLSSSPVIRLSAGLATAGMAIARYLKS